MCTESSTLTLQYTTCTLLTVASFHILFSATSLRKLGSYKRICEYCKKMLCDPAYLLFSLLLLKSLIMSERKARRTSMLSGHWGEFLSRVAITFNISVRQFINKKKTQHNESNHVVRSSIHHNFFSFFI